MAAQTLTLSPRNAGSPSIAGLIPKKTLPRKKPTLLSVLECCKQDGIPLEWGIFQEGSSSACDEDGPLGEALSRIVHAVTGKPRALRCAPGCWRPVSMRRRGYQPLPMALDCCLCRMAQTNTSTLEELSTRLRSTR